MQNVCPLQNKLVLVQFNRPLELSIVVAPVIPESAHLQPQAHGEDPLRYAVTLGPPLQVSTFIECMLGF